VLPSTFQFVIAMIACAIDERMQRKLDYTGTGRTRAEVTMRHLADKKSYVNRRGRLLAWRPLEPPSGGDRLTACR
jgi:hypothetical protein